MEQGEVLSRLQTVFDAVFLDPVTVTAQLSANDVAEWDSLTHVSLVVAIEKEFGIRFSTGEIESTQNVGDLARLIIKRVESK